MLEQVLTNMKLNTAYYKFADILLDWGDLRELESIICSRCIK